MTRKGIILVFLICSASILGHAQISTLVTNGIETRIEGALDLVLDGNFENYGTLIATGGSVILNGASDQYITNDTGAFSHLKICKPGGNAVALSDFEVNDSLIIASGKLDLNGHIVTVVEGSLTESSSNTVTGDAGYLFAARELITPNDDVAGFGLTISSPENLGSTEIKRGHSAWSNGGNESINRWFDLAPANNTDLGATIVFNYHESELAGQDETQLQLFESQDAGVNWTSVSGILDSSNNTFSASNLDSLYMYTLSAFDMSEVPTGCDYDLDGDNDVDTADLLQFLTQFSCVGLCEADFDNSGTVNTSDLLLFLTAFGAPCS